MRFPQASGKPSDLTRIPSELITVVTFPKRVRSALSTRLINPKTCYVGNAGNPVLALFLISSRLLFSLLKPQ
jgi:hypothetical protein